MGINLINDNLIAANSRARFYASTTQAVAGHTVVDYAGDDYNDGGGFTRINDNSWTVNFTGKVNVSSQVYNGSSTTPAAARLNVRVNGTEKSTGTGGYSQSGLSMNQTISVTVGDTLDMYLLSNAGETIQSGLGATFVTFDRLSDFSAGQPAGFGVATPDVYGLVKVAGFHLSPTGTQALTGGVSTKVANLTANVNSWDFDDYDAWDTSTDQLNISSEMAGLWTITYNAAVVPAAIVNESLSLELRLNGTIIAYYQTEMTNTSERFSGVITKTLRLAEGDYLDLIAFVNTSTNLDGSPFTSFSGHRIGN